MSRPAASAPLSLRPPRWIGGGPGAGQWERVWWVRILGHYPHPIPLLTLRARLSIGSEPRPVRQRLSTLSHHTTLESHPPGEPGLPLAAGSGASPGQVQGGGNHAELRGVGDIGAWKIVMWRVRHPKHLHPDLQF